jgi:hypothetical protein
MESIPGDRKEIHAELNARTIYATTEEVAEKLFVEPVLCQGMTLVVPKRCKINAGFSPCYACSA